MAELGKVDTFEFNKVAGAILGALLFTVAVGLLGDAIFSPSELLKPGYNLPAAGAASSGGETGAPKPAPVAPLPERLAKADVKKGEADTKPCQACHNFEKGAGVKIGPPLWGVVERPKGSVSGFDYSAGMKAKGGNWSFADLDTFLTKPQAYVNGTKMSFGGFDNPQERADVIAYLDTLSDHPVPLHKPAAKPAAAPAAKPAAPVAKPAAPAAPAPKAK